MALTRPREAALFEAATRLFRERGFHATSMQDLADALAMNRGSLYHYIESKDDLLWAIVSGALEALDDEVRPALADDGRSARSRLEAGIEAHLRYAATERDELALLQIEVRSLSDARREELLARRDEYEALWRAAVADGVGREEFRPVDVRLTAIAILSACNWFVQWYRPDGELSAAEIARRIGDLYLNGLMPCDTEANA